MKKLPDTPNIQFLLREAKALKSSHRNGDLRVCATIGRFDTSFHGLSNQNVLDSRFSILDAQRVVARLYGFSSWSRMKKYVDRSVKGNNPADVPLRNAVFNRQEKLQNLMQKYKSKQGDYKSKLAQYQELSMESTQFLRKAFDRHGWPGPDIVGADCVEALTYVSANVVFDAEFQNESTQLMGEALSEGGVCANFHAGLRDWYLVLSKQPSVFGALGAAYYDDDGVFKLMQHPVVAPQNLEKRRAQVGYESVDAVTLNYAKLAVEENWNIGTYEECVKGLEHTSTKGGYQSQSNYPKTV